MRQSGTLKSLELVGAMGARSKYASLSEVEGRADPRLAALQAADPTVMEEVLTELAPRVRGWLSHLIGASPELDDATQDAMAEIAAALPRYEGRSSLATLAHTITVRVAYKVYDRHKRATQAQLELVPPPAEQLDPESKLMEREAVRRMRQCLDRLPPKRRTALVLCGIEGLTTKEAAEVEGCSHSTMRSRVMYARRELGRLLAADPYIAALTKGGRRDDGSTPR